MVAILRGKLVFVAVFFLMLQSTPTESAVGLAGFGSGISARFREGPPTASASPEDAAEV